jgi:hypothetical protein
MTLFTVTSETITLLLAVYGAVVSTCIYLYDRRTRIKVWVMQNFADNRVFVIEAANVGLRGTSLGEVRLEFPKDRAVPVSDEALNSRNFGDPYEIAPGKPDLIIVANGAFMAERMKNWGFRGELPFRAAIRGTGRKLHRSKKKLLDLSTGIIIDRPLVARLKWIDLMLRGW